MSKRARDEESEQVFENEEYSDDFASDSDSDAPEAVSMSTSKADIMTKIKAEREALRHEKEKRRKRAAQVQEQNRQARLKKLETVQNESEQEEDDDEEGIEIKAVGDLAPLPDSVVQTALAPRQIRFASDSEEEEADFNLCDSGMSPEESRKKRAAEARQRLLKDLPFGVSEVGKDGRARITKEEIKARRKISRSKYQTAGSTVRRIDSVLERSQKSRGPAKIFSRSF